VVSRRLAIAGQHYGSRVVWRTDAYWHIASFRCAAKLVAYWTNNGQTSSGRLKSYAAIDPKRTLGSRVYVSHYNLCPVHEAHGNMTPAMSLGITDHVWSIGELIDSALAQVPPSLGRRHTKPNLSVIDGGKI
jgi:hypothetical protein